MVWGLQLHFRWDAYGAKDEQMTGSMFDDVISGEPRRMFAQTAQQS